MENARRRTMPPQVGRNARRLRGTSPTLAEISDRMARLGSPVSLNNLSKLERGQRDIDVDELLALAKALGVPPLVLLFPVGTDHDVELLPGQHHDAWEAAQWFTGEAPFPGAIQATDDITFRVTDDDDSLDDQDLWEQSAAALREHRKHEGHLRARRLALRAARIARSAARRAATDQERDIQERNAADEEAKVVRCEREIHELRQSMRRNGINPPRLPDNLVHLDDDNEDTHPAGKAGGQR